MQSEKFIIHRFGKEDTSATTRRASKVCTSLITARTNEEITVFDKALLEVDILIEILL